MSDLEPCKLCKGTDVENVDGYVQWHVQCNYCGVRTRFFNENTEYCSPHDADDAWNSGELENKEEIIKGAGDAPIDLIMMLQSYLKEDEAKKAIKAINIINPEAINKAKEAMKATQTPKHKEG